MREIAELNGDWRGKAGPTDVLAFAAQDDGLDDAPPLPMPALDDEEQEPLELGDIVISLETAARQAAEHGHDLPAGAAVSRHPWPAAPAGLGSPR